MSIVRMRKVFRNKMHVKAGKKQITLISPAEVVFYLIIVVFVVGAYYTFGGPSSGSRQASQQAGNVTAVVARVNGEKIPRELFDFNMAMQVNRMRDLADPTSQRWMKSMLLGQLIDAAIMRQAAKREHVRVSGADLAKERDEQVQMILDQRFPDPADLKRYLKKKNLTLAAYKTELKREAFKDSDALREQVAQKKLQEKIESAVVMTDDELKASFAEARASHILIDPKREAAEALAKAKPAEEGKKQPEVDGDALAKAKAEELLAKIKAGGDFAKLARENSADPGSAENGGDLDWFTRDRMVKEFSDAAFKLQSGQVSEVIKSDFGYHLIKVTGRRDGLPKDFEQKKEDYRNEKLTEAKHRAWSEYRQKLTREAQTVVLDPELQAYRLMDEGKQPEGFAKLQEAVTANPANVSATWELAQLYRQQGDLKQATTLLDALAATEEGAGSPRVHVELGNLYQQQGDKGKALAQYKDAFDRAAAPTQSNYGLNIELEQKLASVGAKDVKAEVTKWLAEYRAENPENPMGAFGGLGNFQIQ